MQELLDALLAGAREVLGCRLVGFYLHGSLALGDFDPGRSDIDFLAVTQGELTDDLVAALTRMHGSISTSGLAWAGNCEGSYLPASALRQWRPGRYPVLRIGGSFGMDEHRSEWVIQRHIVREHGVVLAGPPPAALVDPVSPDALRRAVADLLAEWWQPQLADPFRLRSSEYQAYAVLTMCRALYTLEHGAVATKPQAARWAMARLGPGWSGLIAGALAWRRGAPLDRFEEVLAFVRSVTDGGTGRPPCRD